MDREKSIKWFKDVLNKGKEEVVKYTKIGQVKKE